MNGVHYGVDFASIAIVGFFIFFVGLILYLRREDRREGYPLELDPSGRLIPSGGVLFTALPKTFWLPFDGGLVTVPNDRRDSRPLAARRTSIVPGSPLVPTGNPMVDGIGPAAWAERAKVVDVTIHGEPKILPMRALPEFSVTRGDPDPRGMAILGTDNHVAGTVTDIWIDRAESMVRYLEVDLTAGGQSVIVPMAMAMVDKRRRQVKIHAITAAQFADVPKLENAERITFYEEERVVAYFGGGFLYATPARAEPVL